ncbi:epimerase [Marmoricola endophyticus]|uniref:Epimerase n=1 Tax=Marmoricola endophyticus TaxID=2040280 RepID=A0A917B8F7_9ACTN|nr:TIGR01777 family oxidoreductase [Marmoricola endophyticus]GGF31025.1 epimerase [Marmoricola endophyticus]
MHFLIAGSSGFLGTRLREELARREHTVTRLVRGEPSGPDQQQWDPYADRAGLDAGLVAAADVVVNLAGAPTFGNPHSQKWKRELEESRVATTGTLARAIAEVEDRPVFLAGNGISYYGDRGDEVLDESADSAGDHLLTHVSRVWQEAAEPAERSGARVVYLRTSPVLDRRSAPLSLLVPLFKAGLGGPLGSGEQYFPTISTEDWVGAVVHCAEHDEVSGPVNLSLPEPATNDEFTKALAKALSRPALVKLPSFLIRPAAGDLAPELLGSVRAVPAALLDSGYSFAHPDITDTVAAALAAG